MKYLCPHRGLPALLLLTSVFATLLTAQTATSL